MKNNKMLSVLVSMVFAILCIAEPLMIQNSLIISKEAEAFELDCENITGHCHAFVSADGGTETCRQCHGDGLYKCIACDGSGSVKLPDDKFLLCTVCGGSGKVVCSICKGTGKVKIGGNAETTTVPQIEIELPANGETDEYSWILDEAGNLIIIAKKETISRNAAPWENLKGSVKTLTLSGPVTSLERTSIISGMKALESADLSGSKLTILPSSIFAGCDNLSGVKLPATLKIIEDIAFSGCSSLRELVVPDGTESIIGNPFYNCSKFSKITIPASVSYIDEFAFHTCPSVTIYGYTGSYASTFKSYYATTVFESVGEAVTPPLSDGSVIYKSGEELGYIWTLDMGRNLVIITDRENLSWDKAPWAANGDILRFVRTVTVMGTATTLDKKSMFEETPNLERADLSNLKISEIPAYTFGNCEKLTEVMLPSTLKTIKDYAFRGCKKLKELELPEGVTALEGYAFMGCDRLTKINIPSTVTNIDSGAFLGDNDLTMNVYEDSYGHRFAIERKIKFEIIAPATTTTATTTTSAKTTTTAKPTTTTTTAATATAKPNTTTASTTTTAIQTTTTASAEIISSGNMGGYSWSLDSDGNLDITATSETMSWRQRTEPWADHINEIRTITLSGPVKSLGEYCMFYDMPNLESAELSECSLTSIPTSTFSDCSALTVVKLPPTLKEIEAFGFECCSSLSEIVIPDGTEKIGYNAFVGCEELKKVTIPESVTEIDPDAFKECSTSLTIYGYEGSYAQEYALVQNYGFVDIEQPVTTTADTTETVSTTTTETNPVDYDLGDVNDDDMVDAKDASMILVAYAKSSTGSEDGLTEKERLAADVNSDGMIDAKDASAILAYYAMASTASGDVPSPREYMAKIKQ